MKGSVSVARTVGFSRPFEFVGEATVKTHLLHAFAKLGVDDRTRAVTRAMELKLL